MADSSAADARRDAFLAACGWRVVRFWNNEVVENRNGVMERLLQIIEEPSP